MGDPQVFFRAFTNSPPMAEATLPRHCHTEHANLFPRYSLEPEPVTKATEAPHRGQEMHRELKIQFTHRLFLPQRPLGACKREAGRAQDLLVPVNRCGPGHWPSSLLPAAPRPPTRSVTWMSQAPSIVPHPGSYRLRGCKAEQKK